MKPDLKSCHICNHTACNGNHCVDRKIYRRKEYRSDRGITRRSGHGICNYFCSVVCCDGFLCKTTRSFDAGTAGFHLDAAGAAIATVAAQAVSVVLAIVLLKKKDLKFGIQKKDFRINGQCKRFLKVGLPLALQEFLTQMSFLALCAFVNKQGLVQTLLVRLPLAYVMSIQPHASLTKIGLAAPVATSFGIVLNVIFYLIFTRKMEQERKNKKLL